MRASLVLTVIGPDRPGIVESLANTVADHDGNWVESRMARLAGQFAGILLIDAPSDRQDELTVALRTLTSRDLQLTVTPAVPDAGSDRSDGPSFPGSAAPTAATATLTLTFTLLGHDRPGIVRDVSRLLTQRRVNVTDLETEVTSAPMTGEPLFRATIEAALPEVTDAEPLREAIERIADTLAMDVTFD